MIPWLELMDTKKWPYEAYSNLRGGHQDLRSTWVKSGTELPIFNVAVNSDGDSQSSWLRLNDLGLLQHTTLKDHSRDGLAELVLDYGTGGAVEPSLSACGYKL